MKDHGGPRVFPLMMVLMLVSLVASASLSVAAPAGPDLPGPSPTATASPGAASPTTTPTSTNSLEPAPTYDPEKAPTTTANAATPSLSPSATATAPPSPSIPPVVSPTPTVTATATTATVATATATATVVTTTATARIGAATATATAPIPTASATPTPSPARSTPRSIGIQSIAKPSAYAASVQADSPHAWWRMGESVGEAADDGNGGSVSDLGIYSYVTFRQAGILAGDPDSGASFDGISSYMEVASSPDLSLASSDSFSVELWARPANTTQNGTLFDKTGTVPNSFSLRANYLAGKATFCLGSEGDGWRCSNAAAAVPARQWTHLVFTYDAATGVMRSYINGQADPNTGTYDLGHASANDVPVNIGRFRAGDVDYYSGLLDDVAFYRTALSSARVASHYRAAISGYALQFDGSDDYVKMPLFTGAHPTAYTLEAWVKPARATAQALVVSTNTGLELTDYTQFLRITDTGRFQHYLRDGGTGKAVTGSTVVVPGNWYHVAGVAQDNGMMRLYVNGVEEGSAVAVTDVGPAWTYWWYQALGRAVGNGAWLSSYFQGEMDDVRYWDAVRTPEQIAASASQRTWGTETSLLGLWRLDEGFDNTAADSSSVRDRDGALTNGTVWVMSEAPMVLPSNAPPTPANDSYTVAEESALVIAAPGVLGNDSDPDGNPMTAALVSGPSHGVLAFNADGSFSYTPAPDYSGSDSFTYRASDGILPSLATTVTITATPINDPPVAADDSFFAIAEDSSTNYNAAWGVLRNDSDPDGDQLTATLLASPNGSVTLGGDGSFSFRPAGDFYGTATFTYRVCDPSGACDEAVASIPVNPVNDPPRAYTDWYSTPEDTTLTVAAPGVLANDVEVDGQPMRAYSGAAIHGDITLNTDGSFTYTPDLNFTGRDHVFYWVVDSTNTSSGTPDLWIDVVPVNDPPVASNGALTVDEDTPGGGTLAATDIDSAGLTRVVVSGAAHGTVTITDPATGGYSYTPAPNHNGPDSFTFKVSDGSLDSNIATVSVTVNAVNDAPSDITLSATSVAENEPSGTAVGTLSSADVDSSSFAYSLVAGPGDTDNGLYSIGASTLRTGAAFDFETRNSYSIRVRTTDQGGLSFEKALTIGVSDANEEPVAVADSYQTQEDSPLLAAAPGILGNDSDVDGDALTAVLVSGPSHGTITLDPDGTFRYAPAADYSGTDSFSYRASDGGLESGVATVTLEVVAVNDPPLFNPGPDQGVGSPVLEDAGAQVVPGWAAGIAPGGGPDEAGQSVSFVVAANSDPTLFSAGPSVSPDGTLRYTPSDDAFGRATIGLKLSDGEEESPVASFDIVVTPVNDPPSFQLEGSSLVVADGSTPRSYPGWARQLSPGPENEAGQGFGFIVSNDMPELFLVQPATSADGTLTFTPAAAGTASVSVRLRDDGGTNHGGSDTSGSLIFTLTVTPTRGGNAPEKYDFLTDVQSAQGPQAQVSAPASLPPGIGAVSAAGMVAQVSGAGTGVISLGDLQTVVSNPDGGTRFVRQQLGVPVPEGAVLPEGIQLLRTMEIEVYDADGTRNSSTRVTVSFPLHASDLAGLPRDGEGPDLSRLGLLRVRADGGTEMIALSWAKNPTPAPEGWLVASFTPASTYVLAVLPAGYQPSVPAEGRSTPGDSRYFSETGYRITRDSFSDYFARRGGVRTFGFPISREFTLDGFRVQLFQRAILQQMPDGSVARMNLLDEGLLPYTAINGSSFPAPDPAMMAQAPSPSDPEYATRAIEFVRAFAPDVFQGLSVNFFSTFNSAVSLADAFPQGEGNPSLLPLLNLEVWGLPTSRPMRDPSNGNFVYQRFQRGIMHYDAATGATRGILLGDYLKAVITGTNLPADLAEQAQGGRLYLQYDPVRAEWLARPDSMPGCNLVEAFEPERLEPR